MTLGEKIKQIRQSLDMNLREFGALTGVSYGYLGILERGGYSNGKEVSPALDIVKQICDRADYSFKTFLEETGYIETEQEQLTPYEQAKKLVKQLSTNELNALKGYIDAIQESGVSANKYSQIG